MWAYAYLLIVTPITKEHFTVAVIIDLLGVEQILGSDEFEFF